MRFWLAGPHLFRGMVRPGISLGRVDLLARRGGARTLIAARQGFADVNKDMAAVTGTAAMLRAIHINTGE